MSPDFLKIEVRRPAQHPLTRARHREWALLLKNFDDTLSVPYIIFLGEILKCLTGKNTVFSGYKKTITGIGDECWNLLAGDACIFREKYTELSDGWQRVETTGDRTEITSPGNGRVIKWDGDYDSFGGMKILLAGISDEEETAIRKLADELFDEVNFKKTGGRRNNNPA